MFFPAGRYFIGDLCYVSDNTQECLIPDWESFLVHTSDLTDYQGTYDSRWCAGDATAYGDGTYTDNKGREYPVDSSSIGIIQIKESDNEEFIKSIVDSEIGLVHTFSKGFNVKFDNGLFKFGDIVIDTRSDFEEDDMDDYDYDDDNDEYNDFHDND